MQHPEHLWSSWFNFFGLLTLICRFWDSVEFDCIMIWTVAVILSALLFVLALFALEMHFQSIACLQCSPWCCIMKHSVNLLSDCFLNMCEKCLFVYQYLKTLLLQQQKQQLCNDCGCFCAIISLKTLSFKKKNTDFY